LKRIALAVALAVLLMPQAYAGPWLKSLASAQQKAKNSKQLIFVDMFADWSGWCHRMEQEVFPSQAFQNATDDLVLLRLNTEDGADGSKLAQRFQVTSLPTFLLITPDMTIAGIIRGYAPPNDFVKSVKDSEMRFNDFNQRVKQESTFAKDYQKRLDLAREFTQRFALADSETRLKALTTEHGVPAAIRPITTSTSTPLRSAISSNGSRTNPSILSSEIVRIFSLIGSLCSTESMRA